MYNVSSIEREMGSDEYEKVGSAESASVEESMRGHRTLHPLDPGHLSYLKECALWLSDDRDSHFGLSSGTQHSAALLHGLCRTFLTFPNGMELISLDKCGRSPILLNPLF